MKANHQRAWILNPNLSWETNLKLFHEMHLPCKSCWHLERISIPFNSKMKWFCPNQIKLTWSIILQHKTKINMGDHIYFIRRLYKFHNLKLSWDPPYQAIMRSTISSYRTFILCHHSYHTRKGYSIQVQDILINHELIHLRFLGQFRIHLCDRTCFS